MEGITSICCGAPMHSELHGVCSRCKEHTGFVEECDVPECKDGFKLIYRNGFPIGAIPCNNCKGDGYIDVEL